MSRIKVALFFHTENEDEKKAYELLCSLGRRKSSVITALLNQNESGLAELGIKERKHAGRSKKKQVSVPESIEDVPVIQESEEEKPETENRNEHRKEINKNTGNGEENLGIDKSLVLKGLSAFGR